MNGQRFDSFAKTLASGRSRRSVIKAISAGALGLFGVRNAVADAGAQICLANEAPCEAAGDCCSGLCAFPNNDPDHGACFPNLLGQACTVTEGCEAGGTQTECQGGICCLMDGQACIDGSTCCSGTCADGVCAPPDTCAHIGQSCATNADCCGLLGCREDGVCDSAYCGVIEEFCASNSDCCSPFTCQGGQCIDMPGTECGTESSLCDNDSHCCDGYICGANHECVASDVPTLTATIPAGTTPTPVATVPAGQTPSPTATVPASQTPNPPLPTPAMTSTPSASDPVAPAPTKNRNDAAVSQLPSTGSGSGDGGEGVIAGIGVAAGAVAAAGLLSRRFRQPPITPEPPDA